MGAVTGFVMFSDKILQPLVALSRCLLNRGSLTWKIHRGTAKWPHKTGTRLIQVAVSTG